MTKKQVGWFIFFVVVAIIIGTSLLDLLYPRNRYGVIDFEDRWMRNFSGDYQTAINYGDDWVKDAKMVALRVAGYPNEDKIPPEKVDVETTQDGITIVTILSRRLMDDSIARRETRVELVKDGEIWKVIWAGMRQQCIRDVFWPGWTTSLCS